VAAQFPIRGPIHAVIMGEAPGPLGADRSGIPFWGDRAGRPLYRALERAGCVTVPDAAWSHWDGEALRLHGLAPELRSVALTNAFDRCPTNDGRHFRAPSDLELLGPTNVARLQEELARAAQYCPGRLLVIALGRRAERILRFLEKPSFALRALPHPSAQGLLSTAAERGRGQRLLDLERGWEEALVKLLCDSSLH
jgi:hypothetical protein